MNNQIEELELNIETAKDIMSKRDALLRLMDNADFKKVILNGFLEDEAIRLVHALADPAMAAHLDHVRNEMTSISVLKLHLNTTIIMGNNAEQALLDAEEALDEIRAEEGDI